MYYYGSWKVVVYDTLTAGKIIFIDKPAYDDITLYVGDSCTPTALASGLLLPAWANESGRFVYRWYLYEGSDPISGIPYGRTTNNDYLSIDPENGEVTVSEYAMDGDTATIRATFGVKYGECSITVSTIKYSVTVITEAMEGTKAYLKANDAPSAKVFDKWVATSGDVYFSNVADAETYFVMPGEDVAVEVTYKDKIVLNELSATVAPRCRGDARPDRYRRRPRLHGQGGMVDRRGRCVDTGRRSTVCRRTEV